VSEPSKISPSVLFIFANHNGVARYSLFTIAQYGRISNGVDAERGLARLYSTHKKNRIRWKHGVASPKYVYGELVERMNETS
jgi:hypothetical protein